MMKIIDRTKAVTQRILEKSFKKIIKIKIEKSEKHKNIVYSVCLLVLVFCVFLTFCAVLCVCFVRAILSWCT